VYTCYMAYSILLPPPRRLRLQPCLSVCLLTGLLKNYWSNLCEITSNGWT